MAGSYRHLVDSDNKLYDENYSLIENMRDARECIDELFAMVQYLTNGDKAFIHQAYLEGYFKKNCPPENIVHATYDKFWY